MTRKIANTTADLELLKRFVESAGKSLVTFRYFNTRPYDVIGGHLYTMLALDEHGNPVGYGHLDPDKDITWLGICVAESATGKGWGKVIMHDLVEQAERSGLAEIVLKVDAANTNAVALYKKFGFEVTGGEEGQYYLMKKRISR